jgi:effector-binding domain-containing protein
MINKYKEDEILFQKKEVELQNEFNKFVKKNKVISKRVIEESELKDAIQDLKAIVAINKALFITSNRVKKDRKKNTKKGYINIGYINFQYTINRKKNITYEIANVLLKQYIKVVFKGRFKEYKAIYKNGSVDIKVKK